jgi:hypothetical protein
MNSRLFLFTLLAASLATSATFADPPLLKPFRAAETASKPLAGAWTATFVFKRKDNGTREEVTYRVDVAPDLTSLTLSALPPISSDPDDRNSPITGRPIPADWDGELLRAHTERSFQDGKAQISIVKKYVLRPGTDGRHAGISYRVTVNTSLPRDERSNTVTGEGEIVRVR